MIYLNMCYAPLEKIKGDVYGFQHSICFLHQVIEIMNGLTS